MEVEVEYVSRHIGNILYFFGVILLKRRITLSLYKRFNRFKRFLFTKISKKKAFRATVSFK
jgi:hypothetical protein